MSGYAHLNRGTLTEEQVIAIRTAYARGYKSSYQLAAEYGRTQASIQSIVQGCLYKWAGGPITWPGQRLSRFWTVRGRCKEELCGEPIGDSWGARHRHLCERCFAVSKIHIGRKKLAITKTLTCRVCRQKFR